MGPTVPKTLGMPPAPDTHILDLDGWHLCDGAAGDLDRDVRSKLTARQLAATFLNPGPKETLYPESIDTVTCRRCRDARDAREVLECLERTA